MTAESNTETIQYIYFQPMQAAGSANQNCVQMQIKLQYTICCNGLAHEYLYVYILNQKLVRS